MRITALATREGAREEIDSKTLVPGDLVTVSSGMAVPADIRLVGSRDLKADESLLTGESMAVEKSADAQLDRDTPLGDRATLLHAGSTVASGRGTGMVCRTGTMTEIGRIAESLAGEEQVPPLVIRVRRFTRVIAVGVLAIILVLGLMQALRGDDLLDIFFLAVALAVSAIPAGLPVAITVALSIGSNRMARRNVIVRKLPAVEGLGACTLIASDKTGTLTQNQLTVKRLRPVEGADIEVGGAGYAPEGDFSAEDGTAPDESWLREVAIAGALCNEGDYDVEDGNVRASGDTVDVALLVLARKLGLFRDSLLERHPEEEFVPFESERRFAASFNRRDGRIVAHVKGATQTLVEMCDVDAQKLRAREEDLAADGFRVIGVASGVVDEATPEALRNQRFLGLVGLIDPVREQVPDATAACHDAGVEVRMVTGDHPGTALAIGQRLSIAETGQDVITGREIGRIEEGGSGRSAAQILDAAIFARVEPRQNTTIVQTFRTRGISWRSRATASTTRRPCARPISASRCAKAAPTSRAMPPT